MFCPPLILSLVKSFIISVCYNGGLQSLSVGFSTFQQISVGFNGFRWVSIGFGEFQ